MKATCLAVAVTILSFRGSPAIANEDVPKLDGKWVAVALTGDGMEIPASMLKEVPWYWTIEGNKIQSRRPGSGGKFHYDEKLSFTIDASTKPISFDLTDTEKKETFKSIVKFEQDQFTICFTMGKDEPRPTDFKSTKGSKRMVMVWKRVRD